MLDNLVNVAVLVVQDLVNPVNDFHIRIAPHLAKYGGPFDGLVSQCIELTKKRDPADLCHSLCPSVVSAE